MAPDEDVPPPPDASVELPPAEGEAEPPLEERRVVGSPHAVAANAAVLALTRAARSFTLYEPSNKVVRALIGEYRDKFQKVLATHGPLVLEVHPFELPPRPRGRLRREGPRALARLPALPRRRAPDHLRRGDRLGGAAASAPDPLDPLHRRAPAGGRPRHPAAQGGLRPRRHRRHRGLRARGGVRGALRSTSTFSAAPSERYDPPGAVGPAAAALRGGRAPAVPPRVAGAPRAAARRGVRRRRSRRRRCARWPSCCRPRAGPTSRPCSASPSRCASSCSSSGGWTS